MIPEDFDPTNYPPRYEVWNEDNARFIPYIRLGYQLAELFCDEREWLARPSHWGVEFVAEPRRSRARNLLQHHICQSAIRCQSCQPYLRFMFTEGGFNVDECFREYGHLLNQIAQQEPAIRNESIGTCECGVQLTKKLCGYFRGLMTMREVEVLTNGELRGVLSRTSQSKQQWDSEFVKYLRWLALELCGPNPFHPVALDPAWRTSTSVGIASQMYDSRDFGAMPILADALQDAGCENDAILRHCREEATHVRGCWVVDLVLEK